MGLGLEKMGLDGHGMIRWDWGWEGMGMGWDGKGWE